MNVFGSKGVLIMFICNHCPYVLAILDKLVVETDVLQTKGIGVVAINPNDFISYPDDSFDNMIAISKKYGFGFPYLIDESQDVTKNMEQYVPQIFMVTIPHELQYRGRFDDRGSKKNNNPNQSDLFRAMFQISRTGSGPKEQTPSIGCSIKWRKNSYMISNAISNAVRFLSADAVQKAKSGHPGAPMGMADIANVLWRKYLKHNPRNPNWMNRDRFILSNGHGSMLLYSLLHLTGYKVSMSDIKNFRQLHSITPGHPECDITPGVETTTGPLGQGLANGVGMAIAEKSLASEFNKPGFNIIDHCTYVFVGDGCLMEGISHEVCSLAGTLSLNKLIVFYDMNNISIDGDTALAFTENVQKRFQSYGWNVVNNVDGHNISKIDKSIKVALKEKNKPTLICMKTKIGFGSPNKQGTASAHGAPLGDDELLLARKELNWNYAPFEIPKKIYNDWDCKLKAIENDWNKSLSLYKKKYPKDFHELQRRKNHA